MTAVVGAEEDARLEATMELRSLHSSPCEWFVCDDPSTCTRGFIIQCVQVITMGGEIGCMINEGPWIFVGLTNAVMAWNTQTSVQLSLDGPTGQVYALVGVNDMLFAGVQDGQILAWKYNVVGNSFEPAASLTGHRLAVVSIVVGGSRLYSGSIDHTIRDIGFSKRARLDFL